MTMTHTQRARDAARANEIPDWMQPCDQAQEHWDHVNGSRSDLQNAYDHSRMQHDNGMGAVRALVAQGLHVVVMSGPAYCRHTDAVIGTRHFVVSSHLSRAVAERRCGALAAQDDGSECGYGVYPLPPQPEPRQAAVDLYADDIPF